MNDLNPLPESDHHQAADPPPTVFTLTPGVVLTFGRRVGVVLTALFCAYLFFCTIALIAYRWVDPPITGVQLQRSVAAWGAEESYDRTYDPIPIAAVDEDMLLAVVAAEDARFFQHTGIDWKAVEEAIEDNQERGYVYRGGSTITQQLVKNLFQTTHSSFVRKGFEVPLTYLAELILSKERILALYVNVIEWGPGVFGISAAAHHHYDIPPSRLSRYRAAALAACIPNPLYRTPGRMGRYTRIILRRMRQLEKIEPYFSANAFSPTVRPALAKGSWPSRRIAGLRGGGPATQLAGIASFPATPTKLTP